MDAEVLIVGAGPTGLMLANQLVRHGVSARIIDRHDGPAQQTRALGVQARTLEIYQQLGIADEAIALGRPARGADMWSLGRRAAHVTFGDAGSGLSPYPYILILGQDDNEKLLGAALRKTGIAIQWRTELVDLSQQADGVRATLRQPDGSTHEVTAAWVAGCDGARSSVREKTGIPFVGAPYEHVFFVADVRMTGSMVPDELNVYLWPRGFHLFFPMRGADHWRLVGILPEALRGREGVSFEDVVPSLRNEAGTGIAFQECTWFSTYRIAHRRAERFRDRRCFLLGDAAHVHSPVGAQGMNTGLQDAYNLAWKLALVVRGKAHPSLLDTYERERTTVAERLLSTTDRIFQFVVSESPWVGILRTRILPRALALAMKIKRIQLLAFRSLSQIGIRYRSSPLSQTPPQWPQKAPRAGDRFPWLRLRLSADGPVEDVFRRLDDRGFQLLAVGQPGLDGDRSGGDFPLSRLTIPGDGANGEELDRARVPRPSFYLLRPDGYVGLCGRTLEPAGIERYFRGLREGTGVRG